MRWLLLAGVLALAAPAAAAPAAPAATAPQGWLARLGIERVRLDRTPIRIGLDEARLELLVDGTLLLGDGTGLPTAPGGLTMLLTADGIPIPELLRVMPVEGLEAEGILDGRLPLVLEGEAFRVEGGDLHARGPGVIRYRPATAPAGLGGAGASTELLLQALQDFRYDRLAVTLDGRSDGPMQAKLAIAGRNPALYDGYPVELNISLEGELATILRRGIDAYNLPSGIAGRVGRLLGR